MTTTLPKVTTIATAEENKAKNHTALRNITARIATASGSFIRFMVVLAIATVLATPLPFLALKVAIGIYIPEFLLIPFLIAGTIGIPYGVLIYLVSLVKNKPLVNLYINTEEK